MGEQSFKQRLGHTIRSKRGKRRPFFPSHKEHMKINPKKFPGFKLFNGWFKS